MAAGVRAAYHNMNLIYQAYCDDNGELEVQPAGHVAIEQQWDDEGRLISRTYLDADGKPMNRIDGYSKAVLTQDQESIWNVHFYDVDGKEIPSDGLNLARDIKINTDGWSEWITPKYDVENNIVVVGDYVLGDGNVGDSYTCTFEIEFKDVAKSDGGKFSFRTAGMADGVWDNWQEKNFWNFSFVEIDDLIDDEIYLFTRTVNISEEMLSSASHTIGFRLDYWASGAFRIRNVKVEKGNDTSEWTPGL